AYGKPGFTVRFEINRQPTRNFQGGLRITARPGRVLGRTVDVAVLGYQQCDAFAHASSKHILVRGFGHSQDVVEVGVARAALIAQHLQLLEREFAYAFEQPIARRTGAVIDDDQRFSGESAQQVDYRLRRAAEWRCKVDHGIDRPALNEDPEPCQETLLDR